MSITRNDLIHNDAAVLLHDQWRVDPRYRALTHRAARSIILTSEGGMGPEQRWAVETPWTEERIADWWADPRGFTLVDYGSGIGRLSHRLTERGFDVIDVDASHDMLRLGLDYSDRRDGAWVLPAAFHNLVARGLVVDGAVAVWSLQHIPDPGAAIRTIRRSLGWCNVGRPFFVLNTDRRWVPVTGTPDWNDDGIDIHAEILASGFRLEQDIDLAGSPILGEGRSFRIYVTTLLEQ